MSLVDKTVQEEHVELACVHCGGIVDYSRRVFGIAGNVIRTALPDPVVCDTQDCIDKQVSVEQEQERVAGEEYRQSRVYEAKKHIPLRYAQAISSELIDPKIAETGIGDSLFITGSVGTGKTFQACCAWMRYALLSSDRPVAVFLTASKLLERIRRSFDGEPFIIHRNTYLIIDDFGTHKITDWAQQCFLDIINDRYNDMSTTIITSNLSLADISRLYGDMVSSRIAESYRVVKIDGTDRRLA